MLYQLSYGRHTAAKSWIGSVSNYASHFKRFAFRSFLGPPISPSGGTTMPRVALILAVAIAGAASVHRGSHRSTLPPLTRAALTGNNQDGLPYTSLDQYVRDLKATIPGRGSNAFIEPDPTEIDQFGSAMQALLTGDVDTARQILDGVYYDLFVLNDESGKSYLVAQERASPFRGQGTYIVDPQYARNAVIEVPHPLWDVNTPEEGVAIIQALEARALFIAGTHRCANPDTPSGCQGTTTSCDTGSIPVRISDAPHFTRNFMYAAHGATLQLVPAALSLNIHGNTAEPYGIQISDGTRVHSDEAPLVNRLRFALRDRVGGDAGSCNWADDNLQPRNLCGTDNVQGRLSNGSLEPCTQGADGPSGLFLHIEQHRYYRDNPGALIDALLEVL